MGYPTQRRPFVLLLHVEPPHISQPSAHENVENVKWGLIAMAFGASATVIDLP